MLEVRSLAAGYGRIPVVIDASFTVHAGEILVILGPNGAGKSTLLRAVAGLLPRSGGQVILDGKDITRLGTRDIVQSGLRLVLDGHRVFPDLTIADNLRLGAFASPAKRIDRALEEEVLEIFPILKEKYRDTARGLSGGQQQMLALAQAFVARPKALLCDEPSLGLAQALMPSIMSFLRRWADAGAAIVLVEQQLELALETADRALVIERGEVRLAGTARELQRDPRVQDIFLGVDAV
jgi:branched-chain amino acid transport system ATP-binding protein